MSSPASEQYCRTIRHVACDEAVLLGAPVGEMSVDAVLSDKLAVFRLLIGGRLSTLHAHDALYLLKNCFSMPKLLHTLRCAACYKSAVLSEYDDVVRHTLKAILNIDRRETVWNQATLPVSSGAVSYTHLTLPTNREV